MTDDSGVVEAELQAAPGYTGRYEVSAEIADTAGGRTARPIRLEASAMHVGNLIIGVLGGLAIFIFGMTLMSDGLQQVAGIGTLMTVIVQSSSATIGLAIALAASGLLNFWTAIPIVLGDNIGTTITAILASIGTNRTAKQTAVAHSLFNILGTVVMVFIFYVRVDGVPCFYYAVDRITTGAAFYGEHLGRHVAAAHSLFNVLNVILLTPFIGGLAWLCGKIVPNRSTPGRAMPVNLDRHWFASPSVALAGAVRATAESRPAPSRSRARRSDVDATIALRPDHDPALAGVRTRSTREHSATRGRMSSVRWRRATVRARRALHV